MAIMKNGNKIKNTQLSKKNKSDSSDLPEIATKQTNNTTKQTQLSKEEESNCSYLPVVATK